VEAEDVVKRLLDANASEFRRMSASDLKEAIRLSEGRTVAAEVLCTAEPPVDGVTHGELCAAMGADVIILDHYDVMQPRITGAPHDVIADAAPLRAYADLLGCPVGINLVTADEALGAALGGRRAADSSIEQAIEQGAQIICLYARPHLGGTPERQIAMARAIQARGGDCVLVVGVPTFNQPAPRNSAELARFVNHVRTLIDAGCAGIGLPMPGSKQGWRVQETGTLVDQIHHQNGLAWLFVTGSVEGAPESTMHALALLGKQIGADVFRLDEAGLSGMPTPENILAFSLALRGKRHTYRRMAVSALR
jgi:hypothetical protein